MYQRHSGDDPRDGDVSVWYNNELIFSSRRAHLRECGYADGLSRAEIFEHWNGGMLTDRIHYVDDLVMTKHPQNIDDSGFPFIGGPL